MTLLSQAAGKAMATWTEHEPLRWSMTETQGKGKESEKLDFRFDLTELLPGYSPTFLLAIKEVLIDRPATVSLRTVFTEADRLRSVLKHAQTHFARITKEQAIPSLVFERIDANFLLGIAAIASDVPVSSLQHLKALYNAQRANGALFTKDLHPGDFPTKSPGKYGHQGKIRHHIVAQALSRSTLVEILNITEAAFETGELPLACYAFSRILLSRAARPDTYRRLRCKDLKIDTTGGVATYFLRMAIPKTRSATRPYANIRINPEVGQILAKQREAVAARLGHLIEAKNTSLTEEKRSSSRYTIGDLPLFPANPKIIRRGTASRLGDTGSSTNFIANYLKPLKDLTGKRISCTAMRHTMGTQLAIAGCSSATIAAVLLHANNQTAKVYTDLIFEGAIDELSDAMEDAFEQHFPVYKEFTSAHDPIDPARQIRSESHDRTRWETTGECGRDRICEYAPLSCYECHRFRPAYDVDHTINLDLVNEEMRTAEVGGLQRQADLKRYRHIANRIRVVIYLCEIKRSAVHEERAQAATL